MKKEKILALLLAGVMATTVLGGCGSKGSDSSSSSSKASSDEKVLNFGCAMYTDGSVNTAGDENGGWNAMRYGITETLFKFNDNMELEPWLAESYTVNDEHTEWVVTLKKGLKFSDGCDLTASKVKEAYEHLKEVANRPVPQNRKNIWSSRQPLMQMMRRVR